MTGANADAGSPALHRATAPVFLAALDRIEAALAKAEAALGPSFAEALERRPAEGMFPAGEQVATAVEFMLRAAFPLAGRRPPDLRGAMDAPGLRARIAAARGLLRDLPAGDFDGAGTRAARGQAGFAEVDLPGEAFLHQFGLPNVYFHLAMAHVALKQAGAPLGKADFDGVHDYPEGFSFG